QKIAEEVKQLVAQIDDNAAKVKFNGRALLNGAGETSTASTNAITSADGVTASGKYGDSAVYSITGLAVAGTTAMSGSTQLVDLIDSSGSSFLQKDDTIKLSWLENGEEKEASLTLTASSAISDLAGKFSSGTAAWKAVNDSLTAKDADNNALTATNAGIYFEGTANKNISNFAITVTSASGARKTAAEEVLSLNAIQQSYGDGTKGSNQVLNVSDGELTTATTGDNTQWYKLGVANKDTSSTSYTIQVNDKSISFSGSATIKDINKLFEQEGINVELHYSNASGQVKYGDDVVTKGTYGSTLAYKADSGLNFVAGAGEEIKYLKIDGSGVSGGKWVTPYETTGSSAKITTKLSYDDTAASTSSGAAGGASLLPQSEALQFYIGGEANFGINFSIGKATVKTLLGSTAESFAKNFTTKEGAENAIGIIDNAINKTLTEQTRLGAMEARLGYTSDNIITMNENLEAANSAIRDADIAREMTNYMKFAVLSQSSQYMLAQAGQNAYQVLNLLNA
ncbi:MAG: hypothetical protein IJQ82_02130, partial [Selenomonadaceae bacterium]|nr:hypothetical protein [Selenomonadaceae bacterium]